MIVALDLRFQTALLQYQKYLITTHDFVDIILPFVQIMESPVWDISGILLNVEFRWWQYKRN